MKLAFQIAKRFLLASKKQTMVIILGIAIGVSVQVFIGALISGLQESLVDTTIGSRSQITISIEDEYIDNYNLIIPQVEESSSNIKVVSPTLTISGSMIKDDKSEIIVFRGFDYSSADAIYKFSEKLTEGKLPQSDKEIALGVNLKNLLSLSLNDKVTFSSPTLGTEELTVVGFFDFKVNEINNTWSISTINTVQDILQEGDVVSNLEIHLLEVFDAEATSSEIKGILSDDYSIKDWISENQQLLSGLQGQSVSSLMIQIFVIISVVLGISSTLAITVLQKSKQLGILKAMGIKDKDASFIFLFEGLILGVFGAIFGILIGIILLLSFTTFSGTDIPISISPAFVTLSASIAIFASTLAALSPAIKSSKLTVIEVIRNG